MNIYRITLTFENCSMLEIDSRYIFSFHASGIKEEYSSKGCPCAHGMIYHDQRISDFSVGISKELGNLDRYDFSTLCAVEVMTWDGRDLSTIKDAYYYLPWEGGDYFNDLVRISRNDRGDFWISVGDDVPDISEWFNNTEMMNLLSEIEHPSEMNCLSKIGNPSDDSTKHDNN